MVARLPWPTCLTARGPQLIHALLVIYHMQVVAALARNSPTHLYEGLPKGRHSALGDSFLLTVCLPSSLMAAPSGPCGPPFHGV